jgi:hypothetical protein
MDPYRLSMLSRVAAASIGAYVVINMANLALGFILPFPFYKSLLFAMQISFFFYVIAIIWVFSVRTAAKAWLGLAVTAVPLGLIDAWYLLAGAPS